MPVPFLLPAALLATPASAAHIRDWDDVWHQLDSPEAQVCHLDADPAACAALSPLVTRVVGWTMGDSPAPTPPQSSFIGHLRLGSVMTRTVELGIPTTDRASAAHILAATWELGARAERAHPGPSGLLLRHNIENQVLDTVLDLGLENADWSARAWGSEPTRRRVTRSMRAGCLDTARTFATAQPSRHDSRWKRLAGWFYDARDARSWLQDACMVGAGVMPEADAKQPGVWDWLTNPVGVLYWLQSEAAVPTFTVDSLEAELRAERADRLARLPPEPRKERTGCMR